MVRNWLSWQQKAIKIDEKKVKQIPSFMARQPVIPKYRQGNWG